MEYIIPQKAIRVTKQVSQNSDWSVQSNTSTYNLSSIKDLIDKGHDNKEGGIKLKPFYQRDYKFTKEDESLLIESLLLGIPIPTIYTASNSRSNILYFNVIDGQHRLRAVYRFLNNEFVLEGLEKLPHLNGKTFIELDTSLRNELQFQKTLVIENIHVQNNPALEWEIFKRYNKRGNPLTGQEMRGIIFASEFDTWVKKYIEAKKNKTTFKDILNISDARFKNRTIHEEFYVFLGIYEYGIINSFYSSTNYADKFMEEVSLLNYSDSQSAISASQTVFEGFIDFLKNVYYDRGIIYPLSKEIYKPVTQRNYKCQVSIMMILSVIYKYLQSLSIDFSNEKYIDIIQASIKDGFLNSNFNKTNASTTRPILLSEVINSIKSELNKRL